MAEDNDPLLQIRGTMTEPGFSVLIHLMNWAKTWQEMCSETTPFKMNGHHADAMLMLFRGVGADPSTWPQVGVSVISLVRNETATWMADTAYRAANPMPWCILKVSAPAIAGATKGYAAEEECHRILATHFTAESNVELPKPADVRAAAAARAASANESFSALGGAARPASKSGQQPARDPFARVGPKV